MINTDDGVNLIICLFLKKRTCAFHFDFGSCTVAFLSPPLTITLVPA